MFRKPNDLSQSQFPFSRPVNAPASYEEFLLDLETLFADEEVDAFFEAIEKAPVRWQRKPEFMLSKTMGLLSIGEEKDAKIILDEIERIHPRYAPLYFCKANLYLENLYPAHALRMIHKVRALGTMDDETENDMDEMEAVSRRMIGETAADLGVSYEQMEKASWFHEAGLEKLDSGQWLAAEQNMRESLRLIPKWSVCRNNHAYVLYFMGKLNDAFSEENALLTQDPQNLHALKNLVLFHSGLGEQDKAREFSNRMIALLGTLPADSIEMDTIISVLNLVKDTETLWQLAQKYSKRDDEELMDESWYLLGLAAIQSGHLKASVKLLKKIEEYFDPASLLVIEVRKAIRTGKKISFPPMDSAVSLLLPAAVLEELIDVIGKYTNENVLPRHAQKKLEDFIQKRPYVVNALLRLMSEPGGAEAIPDMLLSFNRPDIDAQLLAFALGEVGTTQLRMHVLYAMSHRGIEVPPSPVRFWNEETAQWIEVDLHDQMLSDDLELMISPQAAVWVEKAQNAKDDIKKIAFLRKAVEQDPDSGFAVHMLGVLLINTGQTQEGIHLAKQAVQVDPQYMFAYANLSLMEFEKENPDRELITEYLARVAKAPVITSQTAFIMHVAGMHLAFDRRDFVSARREFEIADDLHPQDPLLAGWDDVLKLSEVFSSDWIINDQARRRQRTYNKMLKNKLEPNSSAQVTLNTLTLDVLGSVARLWKLTPYGKKAELINRIVERMLDAETVQSMWNDYLNDSERIAFRWVLENNGARPLKEFTDKYGGDDDESPYWNYHKPETIIGRLGHAGLLAKGTLDGEAVVLAPVEIKNAIMALK